MKRKANWVFLLKNEKLIWLFYGFRWWGKKRLFFEGEVKVVYSFSTQGIWISLRALSQRSSRLGEEKNIYKIESETKRWEKKEKKKDFHSRDNTRRSNKVWSFFLQSFCKAQIKENLRGLDKCCEVKKKKKVLPQCECNEKRKIVFVRAKTLNIHKINLRFSLVRRFLVL